MKKKLLLLPLLLFMLVVSASAASINWGYGGANIVNAFGTANSGKVAFYVPEAISKLYEGDSITHVRVGLKGKASTVRVFVTKDLNGTPIATKTMSDQFSGWNEIKLSDAYNIDGEAFYVGYEYSSTEPVAGSSDMYSPDGCWADLGDGWKNYATDEVEHAAALSIQAKIAGETLPNDFWLYGANDVIAQVGKEFKLTFSVMNLSSVIGRDMEIGYSIDGGEETVVKVENLGLGRNRMKEFTIDHEAFQTPGIHTVNYHLISVNGAKDDYEANNYATSRIRIVDEALPVQRVVVEEGTGTWCGWCPRGMVGLREMSERYPDTFIGIAVHKSDKYEISSYNGLTFTGYPGSYVMRETQTSVDPSYSNLLSRYNSVINRRPTPVAAVDVTAGFTNESRSTISAVARARFLSEHSNMNYRFSFVLLEDGVMDYQTNNYANSSSAMGGFENLSSYAYVEMAHLARMNYSYVGVANSIPKNVAENETVTFEQQLNVPDNVANKDNLTLVCLMLNTENGQIENAAKVKISSDEPTGVINTELVGVPDFSFANGRLDTNNWGGSVTIYDASGKQVENKGLKPGFYVLRCTDGKQTFVRKMTLK